MPHAAVNGTELHYRVDGDAADNAPWIVLSNSLGSDMSMWTPQVAALSQTLPRAALRHARSRPLGSAARARTRSTS